MEKKILHIPADGVTVNGLPVHLTRGSETGDAGNG